MCMRYNMYICMCMCMHMYMCMHMHTHVHVHVHVSKISWLTLRLASALEAPLRVRFEVSGCPG